MWWPPDTAWCSGHQALQPSLTAWGCPARRLIWAKQSRNQPAVQYTANLPKMFRVDPYISSFRQKEAKIAGLISLSFLNPQVFLREFPTPSFLVSLLPHRRRTLPYSPPSCCCGHVRAYCGTGHQSGRRCRIHGRLLRHRSLEWPPLLDPWTPAAAPRGRARGRGLSPPTQELHYWQRGRRMRREGKGGRRKKKKEKEARAP